MTEYADASVEGKEIDGVVNDPCDAIEYFKNFDESVRKKSQNKL